MNIILSKYAKELEEILDLIGVGIYITDGDGKTIVLNNESEKVGHLTKEQVVGRNMKDLTEEGFVKESGTLKAIDSGKKESFIQFVGNGDSIFMTATPHYKGDKIDFVVCTERDITETVELEKNLEKTKKMARRYKKEVELLRFKTSAETEHIIADSRVMLELIEKTKRIAMKDVSVLLTGESGTGKEEFAELIHKNSGRVSNPFIKVNCAAIPEGLLESEFFGYEAGSFTGADTNGKKGIFELANTGTLFLDEIGEIPMHMQSKFLRVLQEKEVTKIGGKTPIKIDVRLITATNVCLEKAIKEGKFREDLYYRINVMPITIPPLRERKEDIKPLTEYFMEHFCELYKVKKTICKDTLKQLMDYNWPGNVRELKNIVERMVVSSDGLELEEIFKTKGFDGEIDVIYGAKYEEEEGSLTNIMEAYEREVLTGMMNKYKKASKVCKVLSVNKSTLSRKLHKYNIHNLDDDEF